MPKMIIIIIEWTDNDDCEAAAAASVIYKYTGDDKTDAVPP